MYDDRMAEDPTIVRIKNKLLPSFPELNNIKLMKGNESATINKYRVYLCTDYEGKSYDDNMLTYVLLHELAHVLTPEIGHGDLFRGTFEKLLDRAKVANLYDDSLAKPSNYCGME